MLKENRSFDEYFGKFPGADGATTGMMSNGQVVPLAETPDPPPNDMDHSPNAWAKAYNNGQMNGFDLEGGAFTSTGAPLAYSQMSESQIPNYWAYARRYGLGDAFFAGYKGASFANNLLSVAGQTGRFDPSTGYRAIYSLPQTSFQPSVTPWGCDAPPEALVTMIAPDGAKSRMVPCFDFRAMPNVLDESGVDWNFFVAPLIPHNSLNEIQKVRYVPALWNRIQVYTQFFSTVSAGKLASVTWIFTPQHEHPPASACLGENQSVDVVNAIMNSPYWGSTAIMIYWDEWGGFYDHVPPPQIDNVSYGFRVPFLVISPYVRTGSSSDGGYVSHTFYSQESTLKFIETNWNVPALTPRDATANDMMDLFDFGAPHKPALILQPRQCPALTRAQRLAVAAVDDED